MGKLWDKSGAMKTRAALVLVLALAACADRPADKADAKPADLRADVESSVAACVADAECSKTLEADAACSAGAELGSCPWYKAVGCSVVVAAALAACAEVGPECIELLKPVAEIGCCDCIPAGAVRDACRAI